MSRRTASPLPYTANMVSVLHFLLKWFTWLIKKVLHFIYNDTYCITCSTPFTHCIVLHWVFVYWKCVGIFSAGLLKTHNLSFQDSESLQAVFDKDSCVNVFRSQPRSVQSFYILCYKNNLTVFLSLSVTPSLTFGFPVAFSLVIWWLIWND